LKIKEPRQNLAECGGKILVIAKIWTAGLEDYFQWSWQIQEDCNISPGSFAI